MFLIPVNIYTALKDTIKSNDLVQSVHTIHGKRIHFTYCKAIVDQKLIHHELLHRLQISETEINHLLTVKSLIPLENVSLSSKASEVSQSLVKGFIYVQLEPDLNEGLLIPIADLKRGYRSNNEADNEYSVIGPKVGFVEDIDTNLNLIRKELISENLRFEECIVGSLSALPSFATPIFKMANTIRFLRFPLIILAAAWGGLGIMIGLVILLGHLLRLKSLGTPYLVPLYPFRFRDFTDSLIRSSLNLTENRPGFLRPLKVKRYKVSEPKDNNDDYNNE